jgi:hypothetical protein
MRSDTDKDGTVSMDELNASMQKMKKGMHEKGKSAFGQSGQGP